MARNTWLPWCERVNGPFWKQGYKPQTPSRTLDQIKGEVKHSAEGGFTALLAALQHSTRQASWTFSISKSGRVVQHYPLESITWHCGNSAGNRDYVGLEHEGVAGEPLTTEQLLATVHLSLDIRRLAGITAPPATRVNLWEHNWISSTTCPSNRIPWWVIIRKINDEEGRVMASIDDTRDWLGDEKKRTGHDAMKRLNDRISWHANRMTEHLKSHTTGSTSTKDGRHIHEG